MQLDPVPQNSAGRQLRERKKRRYDVDLNDSDGDHSVQPKRATVRRKSSGTPTMRRSRRSGKLATFVNMPLDVLHEVCHTFSAIIIFLSHRTRYLAISIPTTC